MGFKLGDGHLSGGIKLSSLNVVTSTASSSSGSIFKLPASLPTSQASEPTSNATGFKLGNLSSGGVKLGSLNIGDLANKPFPINTMQDSDDCVVTGELTPSKDKMELAQHYMLPLTFYNY